MTTDKKKARSAPKTRLPWFRFYATDWIVDTAGLTPAQEGCYVRLLCYQWRDGSIPAKPADLARICRMTPTAFRSVWRALETFFELRRDGRLVNLRLERERTAQDKFRIRRSRQAKKAARTRHGKFKADKKLDRMSTARAPEQHDKSEVELEEEPEKIKNVIELNTLSSRTT